MSQAMRVLVSSNTQDRQDTFSGSRRVKGGTVMFFDDDDDDTRDALLAVVEALLIIALIIEIGVFAGGLS